MTGEREFSRRRYLAGAATLFAGCSGAPKLMGQPTRTVESDPPETRTLQFGETLDLADVSVTLDGPRFEKVHRWREGDDSRTAQAGEDHQWLFVRLTVANTADAVTVLPETLRFQARLGDVLYKPGRNHDLDGKYVGGRVPAGERRSGDVGFLVPASASREDVGVLYEQKRRNRHHRVVWR